MAVTRVALRSKAFPKKYLSINGTGVTQFTGTGGGKINTQTYIGTWETLELQRNGDGTVSFKSTVFDNVYLRLDGSSVTQGQNTADGGGVVNCQYTASTSEKFKIVQKTPTSPNSYDGTVGIESNQYSGRFLRMDGTKDQVNVQGIFSAFEEWELLVVG